MNKFLFTLHIVFDIAIIVLWLCNILDLVTFAILFIIGCIIQAYAYADWLHSVYLSNKIKNEIYATYK